MQYFKASKLKKPIYLLISLIMTLGFVGTSSATVKVALIEGKKFTDYEVSGQSRKRSLTTIEKDLNKLFTKLSEDYLKDGRTLEIDVTNLDLPGYIHYNMGYTSQDIRIVRSPTYFKVYFNYRIKTPDGKILTEGEHKLREFLDLSSASQRRKYNKRGNVSYYESPLKNWFKETFVD